MCNAVSLGSFVVVRSIPRLLSARQGRCYELRAAEWLVVALCVALCVAQSRILAKTRGLEFHGIVSAEKYGGFMRRNGQKNILNSLSNEYRTGYGGMA